MSKVYILKNGITEAKGILIYILLDLAKFSSIEIVLIYILTSI